MAWSISKIKDAACPLRFTRKHLEDRPEPTSEVAQVGSCCAEIMAEVRKAWLTDGRYLEGEEKRAVAELNFPEDIAEKALGIVNAALEEMEDLLPLRLNVAAWAVEDGLAFDRAWNRVDKVDGNNVLAPDRYYTEEWDGCWFKLKPDFAWVDTEGVLHVEDDKSGWGEYDALQVNAYAFAVANYLAKEKGAQITGIACQYNYLGQKRIDRLPLLTVEDVKGFPAWLDQRVHEIEQATADPKPVLGKHCDWCGFVSECPAHQQTEKQLTEMVPEKLKQITSKEQAVAGGLWLLAAERVVAAAKERLREWVEANGPVVLPETGKELRLVNGSDWEASAGDVYETLLAEGLKPELFFERIGLKKRHVEEVLKAAYPMSGKGITKDVKAANRAERDRIAAAVYAVGEESPRKPTFGIYNVEA